MIHIQFYLNTMHCNEYKLSVVDGDGECDVGIGAGDSNGNGNGNGNSNGESDDGNLVSDFPVLLCFFLCL